MGVLEQLLAGIDNAKRTVGRNVSDLYNDPAAYAEKIVGHLRNQNAGVVPVAAGGELTNRPLTREERVEQAVGSLDPGHGVGGGIMGSIRNQKFLKELFEPRSAMRQELAAGKHPQQVMREYDLDDAGFRGTNKNVGIRYETNRPLFDRGVVHYDASGGPQAMEIMGFPLTGPRGGELSPSIKAKLLEASQLRVGDMRHIPEESVIYTPYDRWFGEWMSKKRPTLKRGQHEFYVNEAEGFPPPYPGEMPEPKVRDILNDPDLRKAYNLSLAVPADSQFHLLSRILRDAE